MHEELGRVPTARIANPELVGPRQHLGEMKIRFRMLGELSHQPLEQPRGFEIDVEGFGLGIGVGEQMPREPVNSPPARGVESPPRIHRTERRGHRGLADGKHPTTPEQHDLAESKSGPARDAFNVKARKERERLEILLTHRDQEGDEAFGTDPTGDHRHDVEAAASPDQSESPTRGVEAHHQLRERNDLTGRGRPIARELDLSASTIKSYLQRVYEKLGVSDRAAAVAEGMRRQLID